MVATREKGGILTPPHLEACGGIVMGQWHRIEAMNARSSITRGIR